MCYLVTISKVLTRFLLLIKRDITGMRGVSSAGYRPRTTVVRPNSSQPRKDRSLYAQGEGASLRKNREALFHGVRGLATVGSNHGGQPRKDRGLYAQGEAVSLRTSREDPVKQDLVWRELVWTERRRFKEWEKNWAFLQNAQLGQPKQETPLPSSVSYFSSKVPCTSNQMYGNRLSAPMGKELLRLERVFFLSSRNQRRKLGPDMQPR